MTVTSSLASAHATHFSHPDVYFSLVEPERAAIKTVGRDSARPLISGSRTTDAVVQTRWWSSFPYVRENLNKKKTQEQNAMFFVGIYVTKL